MLSKLARYGNRVAFIGRSGTNAFIALNRFGSSETPRPSSSKPISNPPPPPPPPSAQKQPQKPESQQQQKKQKKRGFGSYLAYILFFGTCFVGGHYYLVNKYLDPFDDGVSDRIIKFQKSFGPTLKYLMADVILMIPSDAPNWSAIYKELLHNTKSNNAVELEHKLNALFGFPAKINPDKPESLLGYSKNLPLQYFLAVLNEKYGVRVVTKDLTKNLFKMFTYCEDEQKNIDMKKMIKLFQDVAGVSPKIGPSVIGSKVDKINPTNKVMVKLIINNMVSSIRPGEKEKVLNHLISINNSLTLSRDRNDYGDNFVIQHANIFQCFDGVDTLKKSVEKPPKPIPKEEPKKEQPVHPSPPTPVPQPPEPVKVIPTPPPKVTPPPKPKVCTEEAKPLPQLILGLFGLSKH